MNAIRIKKHASLFTVTIVTILLAIAAATAAYMFRQPLAHAAVLATTRQPEGYTELSFADTRRTPLPTSAPSNQPRQFFFRLVNHQKKDMIYTYRVNLSSADATKLITTATINVADGATATVPVTFSAPVSNQTNIITVTLIETGQSIFFRSYS